MAKPIDDNRGQRKASARPEKVQHRAEAARERERLLLGRAAKK